MSKKTPKQVSKTKGEPAPTTAAELRAAVDKQEKILADNPHYADAYQKATAKLAELRPQLELAEVREVAAPSEVTTDFQEQAIPLPSIVITGNHREDDDQAEIERLAKSLQTQKLQQRIGVRAMGDGKFELIFGSRRTAAAKLARWTEIPAKVYAADLTPAQVEVLRSIENFGRKQLTPVEIAMAIARTIDAIDATLKPVRDAGFTIQFDERMVHVDFGASTASNGKLVVGDLVSLDTLQALVPQGAAACTLLRQIFAAGSIEAYVGQQFSRTPKWVKDHAYVSQIGGEARALLMAGRIDVGHARELAKLGDKALADQIAGWAARDTNGLGGKDVEFVRKSVHEHLRSLRSVPWQLDVAFGRGVEGCTGHACATCPHNSKSDADLFGGSIADEPEAGVCTNETCFRVKGEIIDKDLKAVAKKARPLAKKAGAVTQVTVGGVVPHHIKPTSAIRRLQKDLVDVLPAKAATPAPSATGEKAKAPQPKTAEEIAQEKLNAALQKWSDEQIEAVKVKADNDPTGGIIFALIAMPSLRFKMFGQWMERGKPLPKEDLQKLKTLAAGNHSEIAKLLVDADHWADMGFDDLADFPQGLAAFAEVCGAAIPQPTLEQFLPKSKEAKKADHRDGEWVKRMKACRAADEARKLFSEHERAVHDLQKSIGEHPSVGQVADHHFRGFSTVGAKEWVSAIAAAKKRDPAGAATLEDLVEQGRIIHGEMWKSLLDKEHLKSESPDFEEQPIKYASQFEWNIHQIEDADALAEVESPAAMFPTVRSLAWDGRRYVVLGTTLIRGVECWQLAELCLSTKQDLRGEAARDAAADGNFDGIGVIDLADGKKRRQIRADVKLKPCPIVYIRADAESAEGRAA